MACFFLPDRTYKRNKCPRPVLFLIAAHAPIRAKSQGPGARSHRRKGAGRDGAGTTTEFRFAGGEGRKAIQRGCDNSPQWHAWFNGVKGEYSSGCRQRKAAPNSRSSDQCSFYFLDFVVYSMVFYLPCGLQGLFFFGLPGSSSLVRGRRGLLFLVQIRF